MHMMAFDVETTGLEHEDGHRIIEIGIVEMDTARFQLTGREFHQYLNPQRSMSSDAKAVHGIDDEFLQDKPVFRDIAEKLLEFIGDSKMVAHNASFDQGFLNAELKMANLEPIDDTRFVDSLAIARSELPELNRFNLDALCRHFKIDTTARDKHGAKLDAELLSSVYFRLIGGGKDMFADLDGSKAEVASITNDGWCRAEARPKPLAPLITEAELAAHREKIKELGDHAIWNRFTA